MNVSRPVLEDNKQQRQHILRNKKRRKIENMARPWIGMECREEDEGGSGSGEKGRGNEGDREGGGE